MEGVPNAPGVPAHVPAQNLLEWEEVDDGRREPTPFDAPTDDGYQVWVDPDSTVGRMFVSRPGGGSTDEAVVFHATTTDPTLLAVVLQDAVARARMLEPLPGRTVTAQQVLEALGKLTATQRTALRASVTRRGSLT